MSDNTVKVKPCPICGSQPRYWQWNHGAIVECWRDGHRIQCEAKTLEDAISEWNRRAYEEPIRCHKCIHWNRDTVRQNSNDAGWWNEAICERYSDEIWTSWKDADWYCADAERRTDG